MDNEKKIMKQSPFFNAFKIRNEMTKFKKTCNFH